MGSTSGTPTAELNGTLAKSQRMSQSASQRRDCFFRRDYEKGDYFTTQSKRYSTDSIQGHAVAKCAEVIPAGAEAR